MFKKILIGCLLIGILAVVVGSRLAFQQFSQSTRYQAVSTEDPTFSESPTEPTPVSPEPTPIPSVKLLFGGDLMFDRNIRLKMESQGVDFILAQLQPTFKQYDAVIANLEGPITDNPSRSVNSVVGSTNNFLFTFPPEISHMLKASSFQIVNLGNNHITNFGNMGVVQTKDYLDAANVKYFGDTSLENNSSERILVYPVQGLKLAFVNYNQFVIDGYEHALADIAQAETQADLVIVYTHWGTEYVPIANEVIQKQAHEFVDLGADLIIGSHPHVIQQLEDYKGKRIYYSLGNFVFDQYFSPETKLGWLVSVEIMPDRSMVFKEISITTDPSGQTVLTPSSL